MKETLEIKNIKYFYVNCIHKLSLNTFMGGQYEGENVGLFGWINFCGRNNMTKMKKSKSNKGEINFNIRINNYLSKFPIPNIIIATLTFIVYYQILSFGLIGFDDERIIDSAINYGGLRNFSVAFEKDPFFQDNNNFRFYRPIQNFTILTDASLRSNDTNPSLSEDYLTFHLTNLIIHIATVFCLFYLLIILKYDRLLSLFLSLLFSLHPLFSFNVVWIAARGDLLVALFSLISFTCFIKYLQNRRLVFFLLNIIFLAFSIFSKETSVVLPLIFILYYLLIVKSEEKIKIVKDIRTTDKILLLVIWSFILFSYIVITNIIFNKINISYDFSTIAFLKNLRYYPEFILKFLFPMNLSGMSQFNLYSTTIGTIIICLFVIFIIIKSKKYNLQKLFFYTLWFIVFLLPLVAFRQTYIPTLEYWEHRSYLPLIGIIFIFAELKPIKFKQNHLLLIAVVLSAIVIPYTMNVSAKYSDSFNFFNNIIEKGNSLSNAYYGRGTVRNAQGEYLGSLSDLNKAIEINKNYFDAYFKRGIINKKIGNLEAAIQDFNSAVKLKPFFADSYFNLGLCTYEINELNQSVQNIKKYIELKPEDTQAKKILARILNELNNQKE